MNLSNTILAGLCPCKKSKCTVGECCQAPFCVADFDGNGVVQSKDLLKMLEKFVGKPSGKVAADTYGTGEGGTCVGDLTGDGVRNIGDLLRLLSYYGVSYPKGGCRGCPSK